MVARARWLPADRPCGISVEWRAHRSGNVRDKTGEIEQPKVKRAPRS